MSKFNNFYGSFLSVPSQFNNYSFHLDGADEYFTVPYASLNSYIEGGNDFSFGMIVRFDTLGNVEHLFGQTGLYSCLFRKESTDKITFRLRDSTGVKTITSSVAIKYTDIWYVIFVSLDKTTPANSKIYIQGANDVESNSFTGLDTLTNVADYRLCQATINPLDGYINQTYLINRTITDAEALEFYNDASPLNPITYFGDDCKWWFNPDDSGSSAQFSVVDSVNSITATSIALEDADKVLSPSPYSTDVETDAQLFIDAAVITDSTEQAAIRSLVYGLKSDNIWPKMKALYPMIGGSAESHKWNLLDPRDLDEAFRMTFYGGWTHSSNGALADEINEAYGDTHLIPRLILSKDDGHLSIYNRVNVKNGYDLSSSDNTGTLLNAVGLMSRYSNDLNYAVWGSSYFSVAELDARGFFSASRVSSTDLRMFKSGVRRGGVNGAESVAVSTTNPILLAAGSKNGVAGFFTSREYALVSIGNGLTDGTEMLAFYDRVQAFQTTLGRQV